MSEAGTVVRLRPAPRRTDLADALVGVLEQSLARGHVARRDVLRLVCSTVWEPEWVRLDMTRWLAETGVTATMGAAAQPLSPCPFTRDELREADLRDEIVVVVPAGLRRSHLAQAFDIRHWALAEPNIASSSAFEQDEWLLVSADEHLPALGDSCADAQAAAASQGRSGLCLEEYVLFAERCRHLTGRLPDRQDWTWLPGSTYVSSLVLCAGYPAYNDLFVNVWPWTEAQGGIGFRSARRAAAR